MIDKGNINFIIFWFLKKREVAKKIKQKISLLFKELFFLFYSFKSFPLTFLRFSFPPWLVDLTCKAKKPKIKKILFTCLPTIILLAKKTGMKFFFLVYVETLSCANFFVNFNKDSSKYFVYEKKYIVLFLLCKRIR
jgi:hypothetical protein